MPAHSRRSLTESIADDSEKSISRYLDNCAQMIYAIAAENSLYCRNRSQSWLGGVRRRERNVSGERSIFDQSNARGPFESCPLFHIGGRPGNITVQRGKSC